jgi:uncharacterized protein (TIGR03435 family)
MTETLYSARYASMADLAWWLGTQVERPVAGTGLSGYFNISLSIPGPTIDPVGGPTRYFRDDSREIISAVQAQLGLRLRSEPHGKVEVLKIDHIGMPDEN